MSRLRASDCDVKKFEDVAYQPRTADEQARAALREVVGRASGSDGKVGIYVVGPHNSGKSRLVWEALSPLKPDLQGWTFVHWPPPRERTSPIDKLNGQRVIILIDELEQYATSPEPLAARRLNRLLQQCEDKKIQLVVIATSEGNDRRVSERLASLLTALTKIEIGDITQAQAEQLEADLRLRKIKPHPFDGSTPGSIVVGRATSEMYEQLSEDARQVMKVLKLFNSVGIANDARYGTKSRICAVAEAIFDTPRLHWRAASDELIARDLVGLDLIAPSRERGIYLSREDDLDIVSDYPLPLLGEIGPPLMELEDWPLLLQVAKDRRDADVLVALGYAWRNSSLPLKPTDLPIDLGASAKLEYLVRAADCYRTALDTQYRPEKEADPATWAHMESSLGDVLFDQNTWMISTAQAPTRQDVLDEAARAYQAALEYFTQDTQKKEDPDSWISLTTSLTWVLGEQAKYHDGDARTALLDQATRLGKQALAAIGTQTQPDTARAVKTALANIVYYRAQSAATVDAATALGAEAVQLVSEALRDLRASDPEAQNPEALAFVQASVAYMMRFQASLVTGEARASLLKQAATILRQAIATVADLPDTPNSDNQTRLWSQSVLAETLLQQARLAAIRADAQRLLEEAANLCRELVEAPLDPESLAWVQGVYGGALAHQAVFAAESERESLLGEAEYQCAMALEMPNRQSVPEDWACIRFSSAAVALQRARVLGEKERGDACDYLASARRFIGDALTVYSAPAFAGEYQQALALREEIERCAATLRCPK